MLWSATSKVTMRVLTLVAIESCSTHGRVASAVRTRRGQPTGQDMPGTLSVTVGRFEGVLVRDEAGLVPAGSGPHPIRASPVTSSVVVLNAVPIWINLPGSVQTALACTQGSAFPVTRRVFRTEFAVVRTRHVRLGLFSLANLSYRFTQARQLQFQRRARTRVWTLSANAAGRVALREGHRLRSMVGSSSLTRTRLNSGCCVWAADTTRESPHGSLRIAFDALGQAEVGPVRLVLCVE